MLIKKIGSLLLALTLVVACIPGTMATAEDAAWFDLEVEAGEGVVTIDTNSATGRQFMVSQLYSSANKGSTSTMTFTREAAGTYDIWAIMSASNWNYVGGSTFTLDETDVLWSGTWNVAYANSVGDVLYSTGDLSGSGHPAEMRWVRIATNKEISAGTHTLLAGGRPADNGNNAYALDVVRIVPSSWGWVPNGLEEPSEPEPTLYVHLEAEAGTYADGSYQVQTNGSFSGGEILFPNEVEASATPISFTATVPATDTYDVFALVALKDYSSSAWNINVGETAYTQEMSVGSGTLYRVGGDSYGYNRSMQWVKLGKASLTAGDISITASLSAKQDSRCWFTAIDAIRLVPSSWLWSGASIAAPEKTVVTPGEDGVLLVEAENGGLDGSMVPGTHETASNGSYAVVKTTSTIGTSTSNIYLEEAGTYDIWGAVGTLSSSYNYLGGYNFTLDGEEIYNKCLSGVPSTNPALYGGDIVLHTGAADPSKATVRWVKLATRKGVAAGDHTLVLATRNGSGAANSVGLIDCVAFVPSDWDWTAGDSFTIAKQFTLKDGSYAWVEGEWMEPINDDAKAVSVGVAGGTPSNGAEIYRNAQGSNDANFAPEFSVNIYVAKAGNYSVWNYGYAYGAGTHFGKMHVAANDGEYTDGSADWEGGSTSESGTDGQTKRWNRRTGTIALNAGVNTLKVKYTYGGMHNLFCTDAMVIVPEEWTWTPADTSINAVSMAPVMDVLAARKALEAYAAAGVTGDLTLADRGAAGSTITYVSNNPAISNLGVVTIPSIWDGDATGAIVATATKGTATASSEAIDVTVKASKLVAYDSFEIVGDVEADGYVFATATNVTKANDDATTAVVVLAVYQDNALIGVYPSSVVTLSGEGQDLVTAQATLPEDVTGVTVKAFLWDGLSTAMPYVLPLDK